MSFAIHGLGTAHPPAALSTDDGLALARKMAGPDVRTSTWLGPVYANSGAHRRYQVIGGAVVRDILEGTNDSGSPFVPTAANDGLGPTTAERMALYTEEAPKLAVRASAEALAESAINPRSITHLVTVSCTGFAAPGADFALARELGLAPTVQRTHVGFMGCHGALNGLRVANAFATAHASARVLLCAVELCSLHYYYGSAADKLIANAIFADGAAAVVGSARPTPLAPLPEGRGEPDKDASLRSTHEEPSQLDSAHEIRNSVSPLPSGRGAGGVGRTTNAEHQLPFTLAASGSCLIPDSAEDMGWTVGDRGFEMVLSRRVPALVAKHLRPWLEGWLRDNGLSLADVGSWAVHPGGPKIVSAVQEALALPDAALAASRGVFAEFGNMSSATVLFILKRLRAEGAARPCVGLGFGPGLVAEAALFV